MSTNEGPWIAPARVTDAGKRRPTWWMRRALHLDSVPDGIAVEIVCLGYYELYVNGERVGEEPLAPSVTKLDRRAFAIRHEIGAHVHEGENCIAIWCGSGWYLPHQFTVHDDASPLLRVRILGDDVNDAVPGEWRCREANRFIVGGWQWDDFGGEEVDAAQALPDWNRGGCDLDDWRPVLTVSPPPIVITEPTCPPNRIGETYPAQSVRTLGEQHFEVDFGTCLSGWVDIRFGPLVRGREITLRFYDLPADNQRNRDHSYKQRSIYRAAGRGDERFTNRFNYVGFRYMTIEGLDTPPELADMRALLVESAMERTGHFRCSNELYNRIHELNVQTLRCLNLGGYSVDCPHRERNGYGADGQTSLPAYLYLLDSARFLDKWLTDWCDVYKPDSGRIPIYAQETYPGWGYMLANGATTIWEQWNGFWSQIHSCFAGPAAWLYAGPAGIRPDETGPGFERFVLAPAFLDELDFVEASYDSCRGRIESSWKREDGAISWSVLVPEGSCVTLAIPLADSTELVVNGTPWTGTAAVRQDARGIPGLHLELTGGRYALQWPVCVA